jgi:hypothetical protein
MPVHFLKRFVRLSLLLFILGTGMSCKRTADPEPPEPPSVIGNWVGKYSIDIATAPNLTWDPITFKTGGGLEGSDRMGTYNVAGTVLTATYVRSGSTFSFRCNILENFTKLEGTWGTGASQTNGGQMLLTKN